jgi:triosephosphate isomerase
VQAWALLALHCCPLISSQEKKKSEICPYESAVCPVAAHAKSGTVYVIGVQSRSESLCAVTNSLPLRIEKVAHSLQEGTVGLIICEFPTMRMPFVAGNWKMFTNADAARKLAAAVVADLANETRVRVAVAPPFPYLALVSGILQGSSVALVGQNLYPEKEGAFTGEVSPTMLLDVGCQYVILGHSERRHKLGESDSFINRKVKAALAAGLRVIFCVGETLEEREANLTRAVLERQLTQGLIEVATATDLHDRLVIAYEPFWAIGTGRNATPDQAQEAHAFVRSRLAEQFGAAPAGQLIIQYGGSVKPDNASSLLKQPDVDGALVGGASLNADQFLAIVRAAIT